MRDGERSVVWRLWGRERCSCGRKKEEGKREGKEVRRGRTFCYCCGGGGLDASPAMVDIH
jgi:hypothetical protein